MSDSACSVTHNPPSPAATLVGTDGPFPAEDIWDDLAAPWEAPPTNVKVTSDEEGSNEKTSPPFVSAYDASTYPRVAFWSATETAEAFCPSGRGRYETWWDDGS